MEGIVKRFPGVLACDHIDFDLQAGEVHALLGENGAGKSTLMKVLYGMHAPDAGSIYIDGEEQHFVSPKDALDIGIGMIHQHFMLVPTMTVAQNVALANPGNSKVKLDLSSVSDRICDLSSDYGLKVNPNDLVSHLSVGEQQRVEIIKALYRGAGIIILDEPTAVLTPQEVDDLFAVLKKMVKEGHGLVFISHKLHEVTALCDRITVLRDGKHIGTRPAEGVSRHDLATMMVGRELKEIEHREYHPGPVRLEIEALRATGDRGVEAVRGVNLQVHSGEILGLAGVSGNGQLELAECLIGVRKCDAGSIKLNGEEITEMKLNQRIEAGVAIIPEERMLDGAIRDFSVQDNIFLHDHKEKQFRKGIFLDFASMSDHAKALVKSYSVKTPTLDTPIKNLSGGNIQKLIMARELSRKPSVLVAAQPTRGVDIGAAEYIHQQLLRQRDEGTAILLTSEDLDELYGLSDRIAVIYEGEIMDVFHRSETDIQSLGLLMAGIRSGEAPEEEETPGVCQESKD